jgi:hypothetical protein
MRADVRRNWSGLCSALIPKLMVPVPGACQNGRELAGTNGHPRTVQTAADQRTRRRQADVRRPDKEVVITGSQILCGLARPARLMLRFGQCAVRHQGSSAISRRFRFVGRRA